MRDPPRDPEQPAPMPGQPQAARAIADKLGPLIAEAEAARLGMLAYLLGMAKIEAEEAAKK